MDLLVAVPALLGVAVLTVVNLELSAELADTRASVETLAGAVQAVGVKPSAAPSRSGERRDEARIRDLEQRLAAMEMRRMEPALASAAPDEGAAAPATLVAGGTEIERAVQNVLEAREAERRLERREQMATRGAERLLRDVEVTDEQRALVESLVADNVRRLEELRGQDLGRELTSERARELRDELRRGLEGVLDATQMESVGGRLERRFGDARSQERRGGRRRGGQDGRNRRDRGTDG